MQVRSLPPYGILLNWPAIKLLLHNDYVIFMQLFARVWCNPCLFMVYICALSDMRLCNIAQ